MVADRLVPLKFKLETQLKTLSHVVDRLVDMKMLDVYRKFADAAKLDPREGGSNGRNR